MTKSSPGYGDAVAGHDSISPSIREDEFSLVKDLVRVVGVEHVLTDDDLARFTTDWTGRFVGVGSIVVRPGNHEEVVAVVDICRRYKHPLVPQGGNTGLVGGSVPLEGEVVISLTRLKDIGEIDLVSRQVTVGAGVTLVDVQEAAAKVGLRYPVDFGARGSATVGGMVATNAGGIGVLRFGSTRHQVRGLTAVLGDGNSVHHMGGLIKDNTGYDLVSLLCGSEGTLGIVTAARLQLVPAVESITTVLVGCADVSSAVAMVSHLTNRSSEIEAAELMLRSGIELVGTTLHLQPPVTAEACVLIDIAETGTRLETLLELISLSAGVLDTAVATDTAGRQRLWRWRDEHTPTISTLGLPLKFDVTVPMGSLAEFVPTVTDRITRNFGHCRVFIFGHVADGNLHVNIMGANVDDIEILEELVLGLVSDRGGSISAEHGIGTAKKNHLHLSRSPGDIAVMRSIKRALDPDGIMNPNVLFAD